MFREFEVVVFGSGNDTLSAGQGNETAFGGGGDDTFVMGGGIDEVHGDVGSDTLSFDFASVSAGLRASILNGTAFSGTDAVTFDGIENLVGSVFGDYVTGGLDSNLLLGLAGNDTFVGSGGADQLKGGKGSDWVSYEAATSGVKLSLLAKSGTSGLAAGDIYSSVENAQGSTFADKLAGSSGANSLSGGRGKDTLSGGKGVDYLDGGGGRDTLKGGDGIDYAVFHHKRSDYTIHKSHGVVIVDYHGHGEGTDTLTGIEILHFSDRDLIV
jgi:serralysin